jgi:hypothetical protein
MIDDVERIWKEGAVLIWAETPGIFTEVLYDFPQSLHAYSGILSRSGHENFLTNKLL